MQLGNGMAYKISVNLGHAQIDDIYVRSCWHAANNIQAYTVQFADMIDYVSGMTCMRIDIIDNRNGFHTMYNPAPGPMTKFIWKRMETENIDVKT